MTIKNAIVKHFFGISGLIATSLVALPSLAASDDNLAPVSGFAREFIVGTNLSNATITILETGQTITTDKNGKFGPFNYPIGKPITFEFAKWGYKTTQSGTVIVPKSGLTGPYDNISFQIPSVVTFELLAYIVGASVDENSCHVTTTISAYHKTMDDLPQGEENATITITPSVNEKPFYFDIFKEGPLKGRTNPFTRDLTITSEDGGVAFFNLPPRSEPYTLSAVKNGITFNQVQFICRKGVFINLSPPNGPTVVR